MDNFNHDNSLLNIGGLNNLKPSHIQSNLNQFASLNQISPEFIVPEGASHHRGKFELAFSQIGASVMVGSGLGGAMGTYKGIKEISNLDAFVTLKRAKLLNFITRNGASMANTFGTIALTYSAIDVGLNYIQDQNENANTLISAITTGMLYGGLSKAKTPLDKNLMQLKIKRIAFGSVFGAIAACVYILSTDRNNLFK